MTERWVPVVGMEGGYEVSDGGCIRSIERRVRFIDKKGNEFWRVKRPHIISTHKINSGYLVAHLQLNGVRSARTVHSIVAEAFLGPRPSGYDVCHNNGNKLDNRLSNLRYDTRKGNLLDRVMHGTIYDGATGAKLALVTVKLIRELDDGTDAFISEMACMLKVTKRTIRRIIRKELWKYVS